MSKEKFIALAADFCTLSHLPEPQRLLEGNPIEVDGVDFYLAYDEDEQPDHVMVYCDFGTPPPERLLAAYQILLEMNMTIYGGNAPSFMLSPTQRVSLGYHYRLGEVGPEQLMHLISSLAVQAKDWRNHHFLNDAA